jgi:hypothetical protein
MLFKTSICPETLLLLTSGYAEHNRNRRYLSTHWMKGTNRRIIFTHMEGPGIPANLYSMPQLL